MSKPESPTPPSPLATASAATSTNVNTAVANAYLNDVNQTTPYGSLNYNVTNNYSWTDPTTGQTYTIPQFTATQTLSPTQQAIQGQNEATQYSLAGTANQASQNLAGLMRTGVDLSQAPNAGNPNFNPGDIQGSIAGGGPITTGFSPGGDITKSYGGDIDAFQSQVQDALMQRMNPQLQQQRSRLEQQLADQGIRYGSDAYNKAMLTQSQQENDARYGAIQQGIQAGSTLLGEQGAQAAFQNQAQQQGFNQNLAGGTFANQAQAQQFNQNAQQGTFANSAIAQRLQQQQADFNAMQAARNQYLEEQYTARNQPINEITALMSGSQVTQPSFVNAPQSQIPFTDVAGLINQNFNQQQQNYTNQMNSYNSLMGGILGLGAGAIKASDERVKKDVVRIGSVLATRPNVADVDHDELPIYRFRYKGDPTGAVHTGPMAQDVERNDPAAVRNIGGIKHIDTRRVMGNILRAA